MTVELLFWEGCPSHPKALADLREAMSDIGLDPASVAIRKIDSEAQAEAERFVGSPTIRIDGSDIEPAAQEPYGLTCRIYHRRDGRISATPDPADVREALLAAQAKSDNAQATANDTQAKPDNTQVKARQHTQAKTHDTQAKPDDAQMKANDPANPDPSAQTGSSNR